MVSLIIVSLIIRAIEGSPNIRDDFSLFFAANLARETQVWKMHWKDFFAVFRLKTIFFQDFAENLATKKMLSLSKQNYLQVKIQKKILFYMKLKKSFFFQDFLKTGKKCGQSWFYGSCPSHWCWWARPSLPPVPCQPACFFFIVPWFMWKDLCFLSIFFVTKLKPRLFIFVIFLLFT